MHSEIDLKVFSRRLPSSPGVPYLMPSHFSPKALKFLVDLGKHNDRDWFNPRKPIYETELKAPLLALIEEINQALAGFAPTHVRPPQKAMMRIYRDIRFSPNKSPYKTNVSAWWSPTSIAESNSAGFYLSIGHAGLMLAAGAYEPDKTKLLAIRTYLTEHYADLAKLLAAKKMKTAFPTFEGNPLTRPPKGFAAAPPDALPWINCRQWAVFTNLPVETALSPTLLKQIVTRFETAAPFVDLLNTPLLAKPRKPLF